MTRKTKAKAADATAATAPTKVQPKTIAKILAVMAEFRVPETEIMRLLAAKSPESSPQ